MVDIANFRFDDFGKSFDDAYGRVGAIRQDQASRIAGNALSRGDSRGAANALYGAGDLKNGTIIEDRATEAAASQAKAVEQRRKTALEYTADMAGRLNDVYDASPDKLPQAFDLLSGRLGELGEPPEAIADLRQRLATDPKTTLLTLGAKASEALGYDVRNAGDEVLVIDKKTGGLVNRYRGAQTVNVPEGGALYEIPGQGAPSRVSGAPPAPAQPGLVGAPPSNDPRPRSVRNNNPGNIEDGPFAQSLPGYKGSDGRFAIFETPEDGLGGQVALLGSYGKRGINTVSAIINRWAPASDGNNTPGYVKHVADRIGVGPDQTLDMTDPGTLSDIASAIAQFEGGPRSGSNGRPQQRPAQVASADNSDPRLLVSRPKPSNTVRTLTPAEVVAAGFLPGSVVQQKPDGSLDTVQSPNNGASPRKAEADLRKEFNALPEVKDYKAVRTAVAQIQQLAKPNASSQDDLALGFAFMRVLDPGSVVREGEFAQVAKSASLDQQLQIAFQRLDQGKGFTPQLRAALAQTATRLAQARQGAYDSQVQNYRSYAQDYGVDPERIVQGPQEAASASVPKGARKGASGKYYIGDPNKPGSFPEVKQAPDGNWYLKSASGKYLKVIG